MNQRIACTSCGAERGLLGQPTCPVCGGAFAKTVAPTAGDVTAIERDLIAAAEHVDRIMLAAGLIHRSHEAARALAAHCRELALARSGICPR